MDLQSLKLILFEMAMNTTHELA